MKKGKPKIAHTTSSPKGSGDYYGVGIKQPVGRLRESFVMEAKQPSKKFGKIPKSLA
jgi:hypothetical protein